MTCGLCPRHCRLQPGQTGFCRARRHDGAAVSSLNYGACTSLALDPIEKKPLACFHPGSYILSVGSYGCNLRCPFCQNHSIAQAGEGEVAYRQLLPAQLVELAVELQKEPRGNLGVAFTYNEPLIGYEYVLEAAQLCQERGMKAVLVTNGLLCIEPLRALLPYIDALNIDLKGFSEEYYRWLGAPAGAFAQVCGNIRLAAQQAHVEVTTLVVPGKNDSEAEMEAEAAWLAGISPGLPLHLSRYFPRYLSELPPTPVETIRQLCHIARRHLQYVYAGNC